MSATAERTQCQIRFPQYLYNALEAEAAEAQVSLPALTRQIMKWHAGKGRSRHPEMNRGKMGRVTKETTIKLVHLDPEDIEYTDKISKTIGGTRAITIVLIVMHYFDLPIIAPVKR